MKNIIPLMLAILLFASSCDNSICENTNPVIKANAPTSPEYRNELARLIDSSGKEDLTCTFESYKEVNGREYIVANLKGDNICATADFLVNDWTKVIALKTGGGYRGAGLKGFKFDIVDNADGKSFVYKDIESIVD